MIRCKLINLLEVEFYPNSTPALRYIEVCFEYRQP